MLREEQGRVRFFRYRALKKRYIDTEEAAMYHSSSLNAYDPEAELARLNRGED